MARVDVWGWTGMGAKGDSVAVIEEAKAKQKAHEATIRQREESARARTEVAVIDAPPPKAYKPIKYKPKAGKIEGESEADLAKYTEIANVVGVAPVEMKVEEFKAYLRKQEFPVYDLKTVIEFMDEKSKNEGNGWGWEWLPLRDKDRIKASFGHAATRRDPLMWRGSGRDEERWIGKDSPASDAYSPHRSMFSSVVLTPTYSKVVPLHALQKVAKIEKEFRHSVAFMVCDYAPAPAFKADPFLMAVIDNPLLQEGKGRFVIDVWDEPGFGLEQMLKSGL